MTVPSRATAAVQLPAAQRERWQPIRGGLLNLYRFDHEIFRYENGHLLLRGNNGTGKSRVLALQLPFLLDGEVASHRMEPDGDPAKRIEWNLLLNKHDDRLGYTWIEFGRRVDDTERYLTLGCGLHAVAGRGLVSKWFFVTRQRICRDLFLQVEAGHALTRDRLSEAVGDHGSIYTTATAYRQAVDDALFKLGEHRYSALISLLIQLRQPQLSRHLDERKLSAALSEALPPVSSAILADVAESFRNLESDRTALEGLKTASKGAETFLREYQRYARIAARRQAEGVRTTHSAYEQTQRQLRAEQSKLHVESEKLHRIIQRLDELTVEAEAASETLDTLRADPAMRSARELDAAETRAKEQVEAADRAAKDLHDATAVKSKRDRQRAEEAERAAVVWKRVESECKLAQDSAAAAGLEEEHQTAFELLDLENLDDTAELEAARSLLEDAVRRHRAASRHIQKLNDDLRGAESELKAAREAQTEQSTQLDAAQEQHRELRNALSKSAELVVAAYRAWCDQLTELRPTNPAEIADAVNDWCRMLDGRSPVEAAKNEAMAEATRRLERARGELQRQRESLDATRTEAQQQLLLLESGHHEPPPPPMTRADDVREGRDGAPLWALCDFSVDVSGDDRAGIEAALQSSGLLDAWVTPEGRLLSRELHDTVLAVDTSPEAPPGQRLETILVPAVQTDREKPIPVPEQTIAAVLRHIGLGQDAGDVWVARDGTWQIGPLHGAWMKPAAQYVGHDARVAFRLQRLAECNERVEELDHALEAHDAEMQRLLQRERAVTVEIDRSPDESSVHRAVAELNAASQQVDRARKRVAAADSRVAHRREEAQEVRAQRDDAARDLRLMEFVDDLARLNDALIDYGQALASLWPTIEGHLNARRQVAEAKLRASEAAMEEKRRSALLLDARGRAEAAAARRDALRESTGAAVDEIQSRIQKARLRLGQIRSEQERHRTERVETTAAVQVAESQIETQNGLLRDHTAKRQAAIAAFSRFATSHLRTAGLTDIPVVEPESWSVSAAVEVARKVDVALADSDYDDHTWERSQRAIHRHIQELTDTLLPHGYIPSSTIEHEMFIVTVPFQGRNCTMVELRAALNDEISARQSLLDAREREVLENHLIGEVASHLHDRLHAGEEWVREMNAELAERPMSTGMTLRFRWDAAEDGPAGLVEARKRLLSTFSMWSPEERAALGAFLQQQIQAVRAANDAGTWQDHLAAALDYRNWHRFHVERKQDGQWKRLTRRTHGTASGGEKAIALTMPQFAAAAAHYRSAGEPSPRLILLDEAFVGVDTDMRAKCMGLLDTFDLDFVMTSEREWGCYSTLGALAIYQLATRPGIDAIGVTRWVWNGQERIRDDTPLPPAFEADVTSAEQPPEQSATLLVNDDG